MNNYSLKLLVTGGNGQIASALHQRATTHSILLTPLSKQELDITQPTAIHQAISTIKPDVIINTAAYTAVDKAEQEPEKALHINYAGAKELAKTCAIHRIPLIHLSTDYIFDGTVAQPYSEEDESHPLNVYGHSKWLGEQAIREYCDTHLILRVSAVFSEYGHNFLKTILQLAKEKKELRIVADQTTCPTYAGNIVELIFALAKSNKRGTYHFCSQQPVTWHQFASEMIEQAKQYQPLAVETITAITTAEYQAPAKRPPYSVLSCAKLNNEMGIQQPSWKEGITQALKGMQT